MSMYNSHWYRAIVWNKRSGKALLRYGCSKDCRTWRGPGNRDSSDEEWEAEYSARVLGQAHRPQDLDSGIEIRNMMQHINQQVQEFISTEKILDITMGALDTMDQITGVNNDGGSERAGQPECSNAGEHGEERDAADGSNINANFGGSDGSLPQRLF